MPKPKTKLIYKEKAFKLKTRLICKRCKPYSIVDVVGPVPEWVAQLPTHPGPGNYAMHPKLDKL